MTKLYAFLKKNLREIHIKMLLILGLFIILDSIRFNSITNYL